MNERILCANPKLQYTEYHEEILGAITHVLESESYILGESVELFEKEFASYLGASHCVGVNSGTDALILALMALDIGPGDEVITPSHTAVATVTAIVAVGATPVFTEVDPITYTLDPDLMSRLINKKTKAVIVVHLYGHPCDMDSIQMITQAKGIHLIEDCAQAHGAKWAGKKVGTFGIISCFSFYPTKNLGALGDGGALVTNNEKIANRVRGLRQYGWDTNRTSQEIGRVSRLDEIQAAVLSVKLRKLDVLNAKRQKLASMYSSKLKNPKLQLPQSDIHAEHVFHLFVIQVENRTQVISRLNSANVFPGIHYPLPAHKHPAFMIYCDKDSQSLMTTEALSNRVLSLPMYPELSISQLDLVCEVLNSV
jgi:dTDP-4-amino-4,6-dideoxygalactose transaminase